MVTRLARRKVARGAKNRISVRNIKVRTTSETGRGGRFRFGFRF